MPENTSSLAHSSVLDDFISISRILTGVDNLSSELGRQYLDRLNSSTFNPFLSQKLRRFQGLKDKPDFVEQAKKWMVADGSLRLAVRQIILLCYTYTAQDNLGRAPPVAPIMRLQARNSQRSNLVLGEPS
jgi:hypothetical protein